MQVRIRKKQVHTIYYRELLVRRRVHEEDNAYVDVPQTVNSEEKRGSNFNFNLYELVYNSVQFLTKQLLAKRVYVWMYVIS